jgi:hypothetical protein
LRSKGELNLEVLEHMDGIEMEDWQEVEGWVRSGRNISEASRNDPARRPTKRKNPALKRGLGLVVQ